MSKKLLLADDSITIQKVIQITFANEDCQLTITDNGETAYERAREILPDLILADVYMPGRNGYELCAAVKQNPALRHVPVLLLAGSFEPFDEARARAVGADDWIEKPFESQALIDKVTALLSAAPAPAVPAPAAPAEAAAESFDPFADLAFEEPAAAAPAWFDASDDWSRPERGADLPPAATAAESVVPGGDAGLGGEFASAATAPALAADAFPRTPASERDFDLFAADGEILPLEDDDILGGEDLEPLAEVTTLAPWSRDKVADDESFPTFAEFDAPLEEFEAPVAPEVPQADTVPAVTTELAAAAAVAGPPATTLSGDELEQIVERAVVRAIEKLAGSVLEQVAWEVVPDLAEALIKEEIRKIKEGAD